MSASLAAGKIQVLIGTDYQDWSACYVEFTAGLSERSDSGILFTTGKLRLAVTADAPTSMNPRTGSGRARFFKGQQIILNEDFENTWTRHPHGFLYILKPPLPPSLENPYLELELGCTLEYSNKPQPAKTLSREQILNAPLSLGQGFNRGNGILEALKQAGIQRLGALASVVSAINAAGGTDEMKDDIAKEENTNWIEVAGELAYGVQAYLYQDGYGVIQACSAAISAAIPPLATIEIGKDEISYEPVDGGEVPVDSVVYGGTSSEAVESPLSTSFEFKVREGAFAVDPDAGSGQIELRNTVVAESISGTTVTFSEISQAARGALAPAIFPKDFGMDLDIERVTTREYDSDGKLFRDLLSEKRLYPVGLSEYFAGLKKEEKENRKFQEVITKESEILIEYDPFSQVVKSIKKIDREAIAAIIPEEKHLSPTSMRVSRVETISWDSVRPGEWRKSELLQEPFCRVQSGASYADTPNKDSRIIAKLALVPRYSRIVPSNSGKNQPPATERLPAKEKQEKKEWRMEFKLNSDKDFAGRRKDKSLGKGVIDNDQLSKLAQIEGVVLLGRSQGAQIQLPLLPAFLIDIVPLRNLAVIDTEISSLGVRQNLLLYQIDGREFSHESDRAVLTASLIWLGTQEGEWQPFTPIPPVYNAAAVVPPYSEIEIFGNDTNPRDLVILPPPNLTALRCYLGLGLGASTIVPFPYLEEPLILAPGLGFSARLDLGSAFTSQMGLGLSIDLLILSPGLIPLPTISLPTGLGLGLKATIAPRDIFMPTGLGLSITDYRLRSLAQFIYSTAPDQQGILYFWGTNFGDQAEWYTPYYYGAFPSWSSYGAGDPYALMDRASNASNATGDYADSYVKLDCGEGRTIRPTGYTLQHDGSTSRYLRNWKLQGSNDDATWTDLDTRTGNTSLDAAYKFAYFAVTGNTNFYRYLQILQTDVNSSGDNILTLSEWEFYGFFTYY
ncbi:hypothetical protein AB3R30_19860 [Leptolyngbyaceae cyanobacterium UHCC 1019]